MFIETRIFEDETIKAKLHEDYPNLENCDKGKVMIESIEPANGSSSNDEYDYENLEGWIEELSVELDDVVPLIVKLNSGEWVDITKYINN